MVCSCPREEKKSLHNVKRNLQEILSYKIKHVAILRVQSVSGGCARSSASSCVGTPWTGREGANEKRLKGGREGGGRERRSEGGREGGSERGGRQGS